MNLAERRRALMVQQGDGNLAVFKDKGYQVGAESIEEISGGYRVTSKLASGGWGAYRLFYITTLAITEKLWGKNVKVSADIKPKYDTARPYFRLGYQKPGPDWGMTIFTRVSGNDNVYQAGRCEVIYSLPDTRPTNMIDGEPIQVIVNVQTAATEEPNTVEITNVRLEVVE